MLKEVFVDFKSLKFQYKTYVIIFLKSYYSISLENIQILYRKK